MQREVTEDQRRLSRHVLKTEYSNVLSFDIDITGADLLRRPARTAPAPNPFGTLRYDNATTRSQSLTTKSSRSQRHTWKPKPQKDTTRDTSPTKSPKDDIEEL